ncbi:MAG: helix-turn-helix domain-containing protein [Ktedonobacterales bacterium]
MNAIGAAGSVTVQEVLSLLSGWQARLLAGRQGLSRPVTWATVMRARVPAFEGFSGGELALLSVPVLRALRSQMVAFSLPSVIEQLAEIGVSAIAIAGLPTDAERHRDEAQAVQELEEAQHTADRLALPLIALSATATPRLAEVEREVITHIVARRERQPFIAEPFAGDAAGLHATLRGEALDALLTGTYAGEAAMRTRASQLGYDLAQPHAVLWIDLAPQAEAREATARTSSRGVYAAPSHRADPTATHLAEELTSVLGAWARARDSHVAALVVLPRPDREQREFTAGSPAASGAAAIRPAGGAARGLGEIVERTTTLLNRSLGNESTPGRIEWAAGLGEPATAPVQVHRSATEARDAARLGRVVLGPRHVARPADLGVYKLLLALRDSGELAEFVERTLAPLRADSRTGDILIETLDAFFACNGNVSRAKEILHLHRNSLIYRLARARALLGHDLDDPELRLALQLAIKGRRILAL